MQTPLPIEKVRENVLKAFQSQSVVLSAPTGSGKSTAVPRWLSQKVLVIEPRRVACKSLASHVSQLENSLLGDTVGYRVRDEKKCSHQTRILFVTPGILLRNPELFSKFDHIVFDEFHERRLDTDLLLAYLLQRRRKVIVMSATVAADEIAKYLNGIHIHCDMRMFSVDLHYVHFGSSNRSTLLPSKQGLDERVHFALEKAMQTEGDILVFLPGKSEIQTIKQQLTYRYDAHFIELHGGLHLKEQSKVFDKKNKRKIILSTNVAETSLTIPGIKTVIDSGLVRRTQYHQGRGYLTVLPIAKDSADQRSGRAGRTGPGTCYRLWDSKARLQEHTPPEVHRESLVPFVMDACLLKTDVRKLQFLSPPKEYAIEEAFETLEGLGLIQADKTISAAGEKLKDLPLDPFLGRILIAAKSSPVFEEILDLVCCLSSRGPFFTKAKVDNDLIEERGCDAHRLIHAFRSGDCESTAVSAQIISEAKQQKRRLYPLFSNKTNLQNELTQQTLHEVAKVLLQASPTSAFVARRKKRQTFWSNGGTEICLSENSLCESNQKLECMFVLSSFAGTQNAGKQTVFATVAMPLQKQGLVDHGIHTKQVGEVKIDRNKVWAEVQFTYAKKVLDTQWLIPKGSSARAAFQKLFLSGRLFPEALETAKQRFTEKRLAFELAQSSLHFEVDVNSLGDKEFDLEVWLNRKIQSLGIESGEDLSLLSPDDFLPLPLPPEVHYLLERDYPAFIDLGDAYYKAEYNFLRREVSLFLVRGTKQKPPPSSFLPAFPGLRVKVQAGGTMHSIRG